MKRTRDDVPASEVRAGDHKRAMASALLQKTLGHEMLAKDIESALYMNQSLSSYAAAVRSLCANLQRNQEVREKVVSGAISPINLVAMGWKELSTTEQRKKDLKSEEKLLRQVTLNEEGVNSLTDVKCANCGSTSCDVLDKGRRDVGKSETWGAKGDEGRGRVISCLQCGAKWEDNGLGSLG